MCDLGQDGTERYLQVRGEYPDLSIEVGRPFRLTFLTIPYPHMCGQLTDAVGDTCFAIDFNSAIPMDGYRPCVVFPDIGHGQCAVEATEVSTCVPWHFGWSGPSDLHYTDVALATYDGTRFLAHQVVLASRSPVLDNLFIKKPVPRGRVGTII